MLLHRTDLRPAAEEVLQRRVHLDLDVAVVRGPVPAETSRSFIRWKVALALPAPTRRATPVAAITAANLFPLPITWSYGPDPNGDLPQCFFFFFLHFFFLAASAECFFFVFLHFCLVGRVAAGVVGGGARITGSRVGVACSCRGAAGPECEIGGAVWCHRRDRAKSAQPGRSSVTSGRPVAGSARQTTPECPYGTMRVGKIVARRRGSARVRTGRIERDGARWTDSRRSRRCCSTLSRPALKSARTPLTISVLAIRIVAWFAPFVTFAGIM